MICKSGIKLFVQAGNIVAFTKTGAHLNNIGRVCMQTSSGNREFRTSLRMMVDSSATEKRGSIVDVLSDKDEEGGYISGGWKSEGGKLSCGYSSFRGKRATMEDFFDVKTSKIDGQTVSLFGIFDGHGGSRAAEYLKEHLFENLMKHPKFIIDTKFAIRFHMGEFNKKSCLFRTGGKSFRFFISSRCGILYQTLCDMGLSLFLLDNLGELAGESYQQTDAAFLDSERDTYRDDGSTASTAVLVGNHLYVANVGDSRTVISKAGKAIPLSEDHKPNRSDERKRIENAGGIVMWAGTWRVGGVLAMSRAFGNRMLKQFVVAEPEIQDQVIDEEFELLVLASDGLWDVVPNEDAVSLARTEEEPEAAARKLTGTAFARGSADNITSIVVRFHHDKAESVGAHHD